MKEQLNINKISTFPKVLVAPLEWGLGHATRCVPIINELLLQNCEVFIAAEGATFSLLKKEFPQITFLPLMGYRTKYSRKRFLLPLKILLQLPKIIFTIYKEHQWLKKILSDYKIDAVISDNRFGLYNSHIYSVYITHQLLIKTNNTITEKIAQKIHYYFIKKYNECWVPDFESNGLAGELSHPKRMLRNIKYLGGISRFKTNLLEKKYDILIMISGPEPQRTIFENKILDDLKTYAGKVLFIRGLPDNKNELNYNNISVEIKNHLSAEELNQAILQSEILISRCGYTTVMDLVKLKKKAILIPTPGQTEQEYLADYLMKRKMFYTIEQKDFSLKDALEATTSFPFNIPEYDMEQYKKVIDQFVPSL